MIADRRKLGRIVLRGAVALLIGLMGILVAVFVAALLFPTGTTTSSSTPRLDVQTRCVVPQEALTRWLEESVLDVAGWGKLRTVSAVRSRDFVSVWFIAAEVDGPGIEGTGDTHVWAKMGELADYGMIFAVGSDGFSHVPTNERFSPYDDGYAAASDCVRASFR